MVDFVRVKAGSRSFAQRKMIHGVGVNDAYYLTTNNGQRCPIYQIWKDMLQRCYSLKFQDRCKSYTGCSTVKEWHAFSAFMDWVDTQNWKGMQLDKDLLAQGNKVYGPNTCLFVTKTINLLLTNNLAGRGLIPIGAYLHKPSGKYYSRCKVNGRTVCIGTFDTPEAASFAYTEFKGEHIRKVAIEQTEPLRSALLRWEVGKN